MTISRSSGNLSIEAQTRYQFVERLLVADIPPPARVVELGSAPGDQIARLGALGYEAVSVDIGTTADDWGTGEAGRMENLLRTHGVRDVKWDLEQVPYPLDDADFDAVIMTEVYEHLRDYPIKSLQEVRRILKPGGRLYFTTPNAAYVVNRVRALRGQAVASPLEDWIGGIPHARHAREYTFEEVTRLFLSAGLTPLLMTSRHFHMEAGRTSRGARVAKYALGTLARIRPTLGPQIVAVAQRKD